MNFKTFKKYFKLELRSSKSEHFSSTTPVSEKARLLAKEVLSARVGVGLSLLFIISVITMALFLPFGNNSLLSLQFQKKASQASTGCTLSGPTTIQIVAGGTKTVSLSASADAYGPWAPGYRSIDGVSLNSVGSTGGGADMGGGGTMSTTSTYGRIAGPFTATIPITFYVPTTVGGVSSVGRTYTLGNIVLINASDNSQLIICSGQFTIQIVAAPTPTPTPYTVSLAAINNFTGVDEAGQSVVNGCITTGTQAGKAAIQFSWGSTGASTTGIYIDGWINPLTGGPGRYPDFGTTTRNPFVISGWAPNTSNAATIHATSSTGQTATSSRSFTAANCAPPTTPTPTPTLATPAIISFTPITNYTGLDAAGQTVTNGCITTGTQAGTSAVKFTWSVTNSTGTSLTWDTGRYPTTGTMAPGQTSQVISGWTPGTTKSILLTAFGNNPVAENTKSFVAAPCSAPTPTPNPAPTINSFVADKNFTGYDQGSQHVTSGCTDNGYPQAGKAAVNFSWSVVGASGYYFDWAGGGRYPIAGTTTATSAVINGWNPSTNYTATLHALNGTVESTRAVTFTTNTCVTSITIQGHHKDANGQDLTLSGQKVTLSGGSVSLASPIWSFNQLNPGTYTVTASTIPGYSISYSYITSPACTSCPVPGSTYTNGNSVTVSLPNPGYYADIYFKYSSAPTPTPTAPPSISTFNADKNYTGLDLGSPAQHITNGCTDSGYPQSGKAAVNFSWSVTGATGYYFDWAGGGRYPIAGTTTATSAVINGWNPSTNYTATLHALNGTVESTRAVTFTTNTCVSTVTIQGHFKQADGTTEFTDSRASVTVSTGGVNPVTKTGTPWAFNTLTPGITYQISAAAITGFNVSYRSCVNSNATIYPNCSSLSGSTSLSLSLTNPGDYIDIYFLYTPNALSTPTPTPTPTTTASATCTASTSSISIAKGSTGTVLVSYNVIGSDAWAPGYRTIENTLNSVGSANERALIGGGQSGLTVSPASLARINSGSGAVTYQFFVDNDPAVLVGGNYTFSNLVLINARNQATANCSGQFIINVTGTPTTTSTPTVSSTPTPTTNPTIVISSFTADKNYTGLDLGSPAQHITNGCTDASYPQSGKAAVNFSWSVTGATGYYFDWLNGGRYPLAGTTTATSAIINGWNPSTNYTATLHALNGSTESTRQVSFTTNSCLPSTVTIQGHHKDANGQDLTLAGQSVSISGVSTPITGNPWSKSVAPGTYTVTAANISGYTISYSYITSGPCSTCPVPGSSYTNGNSVTVNLTTGGYYADIYFRYTSVASPTPTTVTPIISSFTADKNYTGLDLGSPAQHITNGCTDAGFPQTGKAGVNFSWSATGATGYYFDWAGGGRYPIAGTTTATSAVINGWNPSTNYTATLHASNGTTEVTRVVTFTTNNCTVPTSTPTTTPSPTPTGGVATVTLNTADIAYSGLDYAGQTVINGCITTGSQNGKAAVNFSWSGSNVTGYYLEWPNGGRFPDSGTMPISQSSQVISGWEPSTSYTMTVKGVGSTTASSSKTFTTRACIAPTPTPTQAPSGITAVGDSLMVGITSALQAGLPGIDIDAVVGRQVGAGIAVLSDKAAAGSLRSKVLVELGTNGTFTSSQFDQIMGIAGSGRQVYFVNNTGASLTWVPGNNAVIASGVGRYSNAKLIDWATAASGHSEYFVSDGVHMTFTGQGVYSSLIIGALGGAVPTQGPQPSVAFNTPDISFTGLDFAGQTVTNGCITTGTQAGKAAVKFSWSGTNITGYFLSWSGGRYPDTGTMASSQTTQVISGWEPSTSYTVTLNGVGSTTATQSQTFTTKSCAAPTPTPTPTPVSAETCLFNPNNVFNITGGTSVNFSINTTNLKQQTYYVGWTYTDPYTGVDTDSLFNNSSNKLIFSDKLNITSPSSVFTPTSSLATRVFNFTINSTADASGRFELSNFYIITGTKKTNCTGAGGLGGMVITATPSVTPKPDLTVSLNSITSGTLTPGSTATVALTITNLGSVQADNFVVGIYDEAHPTTYLVTNAIPSLIAGGSTTRNLNITAGTAGTYSIRAKVDSTGTVAESKEDNNISNALSYTVGSAPTSATIQVRVRQVRPDGSSIPSCDVCPDDPETQTNTFINGVTVAALDPVSNNEIVKTTSQVLNNKGGVAVLANLEAGKTYKLVAYKQNFHAHTGGVTIGGLSASQITTPTLTAGVNLNSQGLPLAAGIATSAPTGTGIYGPANGDCVNYKVTEVLAWNRVEGNEKYDIVYSTDPSFTIYSAVNVPINWGYGTISGLEGGKTYYAIVRSYNHHNVANTESTSISFATRGDCAPPPPPPPPPLPPTPGNFCGTFGDPGCDYSTENLWRDMHAKADARNFYDGVADYFFWQVIPCESGYNPVITAQGINTTAVGLYQAPDYGYSTQPGTSGYVDWRTQTTRAFNHALITGYYYWQCASDRFGKSVAP